jgi:hypothetical protein
LGCNLVDGTIVLSFGQGAPDTVSVTRDAPQNAITVAVDHRVFTYSAAQVRGVRVTGRTAGDQIQIDPSVTEGSAQATSSSQFSELAGALWACCHPPQIASIAAGSDSAVTGFATGQAGLGLAPAALTRTAEGTGNSGTSGAGGSVAVVSIGSGPMMTGFTPAGKASPHGCN